MRVLLAALVAAMCVSSAASADSELYQTVPTAKPRRDLSQFLVAKAQKAQKARDWAHAIPLYQALVVARGPASPEEKQLATIWTLAGQNEEASKAWAAYADAISDEKERANVVAESQRLHGTPDPFADKIDIAVMAADANQAFRLGRAAFAKKQYGDALVYFHMGYALAPDLP
ncbi:MAG TPA: hypothetical protein VLT45_25510, partial [Kofleriaceae bacterium]|nr:hypothetical protein [Kofleriaceae bacterium]